LLAQEGACAFPWGVLGQIPSLSPSIWTAAKRRKDDLYGRACRRGTIREEMGTHIETVRQVEWNRQEGRILSFLTERLGRLPSRQSLSPPLMRKSFQSCARRSVPGPPSSPSEELPDNCKAGSPSSGGPFPGRAGLIFPKKLSYRLRKHGSPPGSQVSVRESNLPGSRSSRP